MKESVEDLRAAGEAFEDNGYEVTSYSVSGYLDTKTRGSGDEPEEAFDEYLREMEKEDILSDTYITTKPVLDLFLRGSEEDIEAAVNEVLRQVDASINLRDPADKQSPVPYVKVKYHPQIHQGIFRFRGGVPGKYPRTEFTEILQDKGLQIEQRK